MITPCAPCPGTTISAVTACDLFLMSVRERCATGSPGRHGRCGGRRVPDGLRHVRSRGASTVHRAIPPGRPLSERSHGRSAAVERSRSATSERIASHIALRHGGSPPSAAMRRGSLPIRPSRARHQTLKQPETPAAQLASSPGKRARPAAVHHGPHDEQSGEHCAADQRQHAREVDDGHETAATVLALEVPGGRDTTACAADPVLPLARIGAAVGADPKARCGHGHDRTPSRSIGVPVTLAALTALRSGQQALPATRPSGVEAAHQQHQTRLPWTPNPLRRVTVVVKRSDA